MDIGGLLCEYAGNIVSTGTGKTEYVTDVTVGSDYSVLYDSIVVSDWFVEVVEKSKGKGGRPKGGRPKGSKNKSK